MPETTVYKVKFPTAVPVTISRNLLQQELAWFVEGFISKLKQDTPAGSLPSGARIIRNFKRKSASKLSPKLVGVRDQMQIHLLPIDKQAKSSMISELEWYDEESFIISSVSPPSTIAASKADVAGTEIKPMNKQDYFQTIAPWLIQGGQLLSIDVSSLYIKLPETAGKEGPGKYAAVVELYAPPDFVDGTNWLTPIIRYINLYKPKELWTVTWFRPMTDMEIRQVIKNWENSFAFRLGRNVDPELQAKQEKIRETFRVLGADSMEVLLTVKSGIIIFADTIEELKAQRAALQETFESLGWQTNPAFFEQDVFFRLFIPGTTNSFDEGEILLTAKMMLASGFVHATSMFLGNMYMGDTLLFGEGLPMSSFFFDPFEAGLKGYGGVSNYIVTVTGAQGSGKSFFGKSLMMNLRRKYGDKLKIKIVDVTGEYSLRSMTQGEAPFIEAIGGRVVLIRPNGEIKINPLEINIEEWKRSLLYTRGSAEYQRREMGISNTKLTDNEVEFYERFDRFVLMNAKMSSVEQWLQIGFSTDPAGAAASNYLGKFKELLEIIFRYGPIQGYRRDPSSRQPRWQHLLIDYYNKALPVFLQTYKTKSDPYIYINSQPEEVRIFLEELWHSIVFYLEYIIKNPTASVDALVNFFKSKHEKEFFSIPRYPYPMLSDIYEMISILIDEFGNLHLDPLRTALSRFTNSAIATVMDSRISTLPPADEPAISITIDRESKVFSDNDQILLYTLLLDSIVRDSIAFQLRTGNSAYFLIAIDEMWKLMQGAEYVRTHIANVLARDTRKYLIGGLYMSQDRYDFFYPNSPFSTSVKMKFFGVGENLRDIMEPVPDMLRGAYEVLKPHQFLMVIGEGGNVNRSAIVKIKPSAHEIAYAEVIRQEAE